MHAPRAWLIRRSSIRTLSQQNQFSNYRALTRKKKKVQLKSMLIKMAYNNFKLERTPVILILVGHGSSALCVHFVISLSVV